MMRKAAKQWIDEVGKETAIREQKRGTHPTKGIVIPLNRLLGLLADAASEPARLQEAA